VKDLTHIRRFNESEENLNISDVSDSYKIAKAIDLLKNKDLSFHNKVLNLCKLMDVNPNLEYYVTIKAIEGLFKLVGDEETKIRKYPASRVSDILKKVFG
jgi:hypothetical protein